MALGYDEPRPTHHNYDSFLELFVEGCKNSEIEGLSFIHHGSTERGDHVPGRSDIDGVLVFPEGVEIDKQDFRKISKIIYQAQRENNIPLQIVPTDLLTMKDGRFSSFEQNFLDYLNPDGKVLFGPDYRQSFRYTKSDAPEQDRLRYQLQKSRKKLLLSQWLEESSYPDFLKAFNKTLDIVSSATKQFLLILDGEVRKYRFSPLEELGTFFPALDLEPLERMEKLYTNLPELDALYKNPEELTNVWEDSVSFLENLIQSYIDINH